MMRKKPLSQYEMQAAERIAAMSAGGRWTNLRACFPDRTADLNVRLAHRLIRAGLVEADHHFRIRAKATTGSSVGTDGREAAGSEPS